MFFTLIVDFFFTLKETLFLPSKTVKTFLFQDRTKHVKPVLFLVLCSIIYTVSHSFFEFNDGYISFYIGEDSSMSIINEKIKSYYGYTNLFIGVFIALWSLLLFREQNYNFFEILVLLCYVIGVEMVIMAIFGFLEHVSSWKVTDLGGNLMLLYTTWATGLFFGGRWHSYLKALLAYILGYSTFSFLIFGIAAFIDKFF